MFSKNKKYAFTLAEIFIVLITLGMLTVMTVGYTLSSGKTKHKKIKIASKTFYSSVETVYPDVLLNYTDGHTLAKLSDVSESTSDNNILLAKIFARYLDGEVLDNCDDLVVASEQDVSGYKDDTLACVRFNSGIVAGFSYNKDCTYVPPEESSDESTSETEEEETVPDLSKLSVIEYLKTDFDGENKDESVVESEDDTIASRTVDNVCGYIIYGFSGGSGTFGKDLFTIALGKRGTK